MADREELEAQRRGFLDALAENEDDTTTRLVYADWLEDLGEHEEADRQRRWPAAKARLVEAARRTFYCPHWRRGEEEDPARHKEWLAYDEASMAAGDPYSAYAKFLAFLDAHARYARGEPVCLYFDVPYDFDGYGDGLWADYETVTGAKAPQGRWQKERPPFRCAC